MAAARAIRGWDEAMDQDARVARAMRTDYEWSLSPAGPWVCETPEGKCYEVTQDGCTCPDHQHRCSKVGGLCKHRVALAHKLLTEGTALAVQALEAQTQEMNCGRCGDEMLPSDIAGIPDTGEIVCGICQTADDYTPGPAGPEDLAKPVRLTRAERDRREDAIFDRLYGGA